MMTAVVHSLQTTINNLAYIVCACMLVCVEEKCERRCQYVSNFRSDFLDFLLQNGKQKVHVEFYFGSSMFQKK